MSQINIPSTQLAQLGFADRIVHETQGQAEIARQTTQLAMPEVLKQQRDTVVKSEKSEENRSVKPEKDGKGAQSSLGDKQPRQGSASQEGAEASPSTPWAGNILNLKV